MKMEEIECSETSAYKFETPWNYPKENILYPEHGESVKSRIRFTFVNVALTCFLRGWNIKRNLFI